ncbi:MAG TPA: glycoside hydrolase family 15 protein [Mycobacteriales bacterium]|jgi:GH15 family glucan-1,4-alpha-glucosidase
MADYPLIADHGLIGDLHTAALVTTDGEIDWFCSPRFDSPSVFASLLDREKGGRFRIAPVNTDYVSKQLYLPDTALLVTRFMSADGVGEVIDFMPISDEEHASDNHRLVRVVRVVRGEMRFGFECAPRFDFGRLEHDVEITDGGAVFRAGGSKFTLHTGVSLHQDGRDVRAEDTLKSGEVRGMILESEAEQPAHRPNPAEVFKLFWDTARYWRDWLGKSTYRGRWREQVARSAMTLKLMTYAPSGGLVAAPTAGLPEQVGGERNWDYRYTWVRDASFSVQALLGLGYTDEARAFTDWLSDRIGEESGEGERPLKIMYRVDGSSDLVETIVKDFEGYRGSKPVRLGNGAADQLQLDIFGEALGCLFLADEQSGVIGSRGWAELSGMLNWLCEHWDQPDAGIWETRGGAQDFTYGRLMSWVAFDRAIRLANMHGWPGDVARWTSERDEIYRQIHSRGWSEKRKAFVQHYRTDVLDASLLLMPAVGFIAPTDPKWLSTLDAMDGELVSDSLVYRYDPSASPDGLQGSEGTFSICTFWYVDALTRSNRLEVARLTFEKMFTYANHLGLFAEEIGITGEQLGNFPQAFTHLALINAAINLDAALDRASGLMPASYDQAKDQIPGFRAAMTGVEARMQPVGSTNGGGVAPGNGNTAVGVAPQAGATSPNN